MNEGRCSSGTVQYTIPTTRSATPITRSATPSVRKLDGCIPGMVAPSSDQGVQLPISDAFQLTSPQRLEPETGARDEVLHGARHEHLAAPGRSADARAD